MYDNKNYNDWNDSKEDASTLLEKWFSSASWEEICTDAETGDKDSISLMEDVNSQLTSLIFHLHNNSGENRIQYELNYFTTLCADFDIT